MTTIKNLLILARFDKPIGIFLILWPTLTALFIAAKKIPDFNYLIIFTFGSIFMRAAGCIINDLFDIKYDQNVKRTNKRLLVTGQVSKTNALKFLIILLFLSFILVIQLNLFTIILSISALFFTIFYPLTKRFFRLPQLFLGITFGFGILMSFTAVQNKIILDAWILFIANLFWALSYDSHYAIADLNDDKNLPIFSSVKTFNTYSLYFILFSYFMMFSSLFFLAWNTKFSGIGYVFLLFSFLVALRGVIYSWSMDPKINFNAFKANNYVGLLFFLGFFFETLKLPS